MFILIFLSLSLTLFGEIPTESLKIFPPLDHVFHPVSTNNPEAQNRFNQGLTYLFAFNHDFAFSAFEKAAELDPTLAMAYWGMAMALGQNINTDVTPENEPKCYQLAQKALQLAPNASKNEQAYIAALVKRYTNDPHADLIPLRFIYRTAMQQVVKDYPEDLDAATLYAESILDLYPWEWWTVEGKPREGTLEAVEMLESVLRRNPLHIGANHYYIHALEESPFPDRALMSAHRLETLLPEAGHLLHMPAHIFLLVGDYENALKTNSKAVAADWAYIQTHGLSGTYPLHYLSHNLYVLARTYMLMGDLENAFKTALELNQFIAPHMDSHLLHFAYAPLEILLYFHKWNEILAFQPLAQDSAIIQAYQHFSRGMAYAYLNQREAAQMEKQLLISFRKNIPPDFELSNNPAEKLFDIAELVLQAALDRPNNRPAAIDSIQKAIHLQDQLAYDEPPTWYLPLRQTLGALLLQENRPQEAQAAFQAALKKLQRNGRLLFGLSQSLQQQQKTLDAYWVTREMNAALKAAPQPLSLEDL